MPRKAPEGVELHGGDALLLLPEAEAPPAPPSQKPKAEKPHYHGHRARLRERFLAAPAALPDYELLEILLFAARPMGDVKPLAKQILAHFGSLAKALKAEPRELVAVEGVNEAAVGVLKAAQEAASRLLKEEVRDKPVIQSWTALLDYCRVTLGHKKHEEFHVLFLDRKFGLLADEMQQKGTVDQAAVYPREVVKRALELGASGIILMHNHPTGDVNPSKADIDITKAVQNAAAALSITVHDHLIIGAKTHFSFKSSGLIK